MKAPDLFRVSGAHLCPVCGKRDWCVVAESLEDPPRVFCQRVESPTRVGGLGFLHILRESSRSFRRRLPEPDPDPVNFEHWRALAKGYADQLEPDRLDAFSAGLGVHASALRRLDIGWTGTCWAFPMRDDLGRAVGIRLRRPDGFKYAVKGSQQGLFVPTFARLPHEIWIAEGPTDCAALLSIGLPAIGRPSCRGSELSTAKFLDRIRPTRVVIVADADGPGRHGARELEKCLGEVAADLLVVEPPFGGADARDVVRQGATAEDFKNVVRVAATSLVGGAA